MKRLTAALGAVALLSLMPASPALAEGAVIDEGGLCFSLVPNGNGGLTDISVVGDYKSRTTKSGNTNFTCHFNLTADESPSKGVKAEGFPCFVFGGIVTNDSRIQASPGGRMVMNCNVRAE